MTHENAHDLIRKLCDFYITAAYTGTADEHRSHHYAYVADEIHKTIKLVMTGHDPENCLRDLVNVLEADADEMPDPRYVSINKGWAYALGAK